MTDTIWLQLQYCGSRCRSAKVRCQTMCAVAFGVEFAEAERKNESRADIVAQCDCAQQIGAAAIRQLCRGECSRHDAAARMEATAQMRIISLVAVSSHAVGERRVDG